MKVIIIEDETPAAEKLARYLLRYDPSINLLATLDSVAGAVAWLREHQQNVDLIFMDIQLRDGRSFDIFQQVPVEKPVIFTTAYNEFALDAFKVNSIDYLLKPIAFPDLEAAMKKLESLRVQLHHKDQSARVQTIVTTLKDKTYKSRFMVKVGEHIRSVTTEQISVFYAEGRDVYLVTDQEKRFIIDYTLESLEEILDRKTFFRVNRTFILRIDSIKDVLVYSSSRLKVKLYHEFDKEIIVSREKVNEFKHWFDGGMGS